MATMAGLVDRLRLELGDPLRGFQAQVVTDGTTTRYSLPVEMVNDQNLKVYLASDPTSPLVLDTDFEMDFQNGVITFATPPTNGQTVVVEGSYSETFLRADLATFIETAFLQHANGRTDDLGLDLTLENLPGVEEYLVVILAEIEALWALVTDAAQEIDVRNPDGVNIPVGQRYEQLLNLIAARRAQYQDLAQQLNVGLWRIEMFTLRRVSRTTNRLVPVYRSMEYDEVNKGFVPDHGPVGTRVAIRGMNFTGVTDVQFGGVSAITLDVVSDELITVEVPTGAQSGRIKIIGADGDEIETHYEFNVGEGKPEVLMGQGAQRVYPPIDDGLN